MEIDGVYSKDEISSLGLSRTGSHFADMPIFAGKDRKRYLLEPQDDGSLKVLFACSI